MAKYGHSTKYDHLAKELITHILGFKEGEDNFTASLNYVISNLLYHHCLDVNSHHIERSLQGISLKMGIHGQQKKAEKLSLLTKKFLAAPVLEDKGDIKWSILSFLIDLSHHPARENLLASVTSELSAAADTEMTNSLNSEWISELMEKSLHIPDKDETLSEWSDLGDEDLQFSFNLGIELDAEEANEKLSSDQQREVSEKQQRRMSLVKNAHLAKSWISSSVHKPYWNQEEENLVVNVEEESQSDVTRNHLTEYSVMRECIWLLLNPSSGFIFLQDKNKFEIRNITLLSLSQVLVRQLLEPVADAAAKLLEIDTWLKEIQSAILTGNREHCGTFESYSDGLRKWRNSMNRKLNALETVIVDKEETSTLLWLLHELEPIFSSLSTVYNVHYKTFNNPQETNLQKTFKLLSLLVQAIDSGLKSRDRGWLFFLFKSAVKNHLMNLNVLLCQNHCSSHALLQEFGIVRQSTDDTSGNLKHHYAIDESSCIKLPGLKYLRTLQGPLIEIQELKSIVKDLQINSDFEFDSLERMIETKLSSKMYSDSPSSSPRVNCALNPDSDDPKSKRNADGDDKTYPLMQQNESIRNDVAFEEPNGIEYSSEVKINESVKEYRKNGLLKLYDEDVYLDMAFEDEIWYPELPKRLDITLEDEPPALKTSMGLEETLTNILMPLLHERYDHWGKALMKSLNETHGLRSQVNAFVSIVLLSPACGMEEFYSYLFLKMDGRSLIEECDLSQNLQYSLSGRYPKLADRFAISLKAKGQNRSVALPCDAVFSSISLDFTDQWPLSTIITDSILAKYNKLFVFCLMLKRAVFTLQKLHFKEIASFASVYSRGEGDLYSSPLNESDLPTTCSSVSSSATDRETLPLPQRVHRLQLLRQWFLYFATVLHDHFMNTALMPFSQRIEQLLHVEHFENFVQDHKKLLNAVCHECLLDEELSLIQTALSKLFASVEKIRKLWRGCPDAITEAALTSLETRYSECHRFLAKFLSTVANQRSCPLVEGLAQSLTHNCPLGSIV